MRGKPIASISINASRIAIMVYHPRTAWASVFLLPPHPIPPRLALSLFLSFCFVANGIRRCDGGYMGCSGGMRIRFIKLGCEGPVTANWDGIQNKVARRR